MTDEMYNQLLRVPWTAIKNITCLSICHYLSRPLLRELNRPLSLPTTPPSSSELSAASSPSASTSPARAADGRPFDCCAFVSISKLAWPPICLGCAAACTV